MSDERPKIRRYHDPKWSPGDMTLWEALRDQANYADTDPHHSSGHRFTPGEIREVLDTIAQLRWDLAHAADWRGMQSSAPAELSTIRDILDSHGWEGLPVGEAVRAVCEASAEATETIDELRAELADTKELLSFSGGINKHLIHENRKAYQIGVHHGRVSAGQNLFGGHRSIVPPVIHILIHGEALCGKGRPSEWPDDHRWTQAREAENSTCEECSQQWLSMEAKR